MIVFLIPSVLNPIKRPLSYAPRRSRFTPLERLQQLHETISSILNHFYPETDNVRIFVLEGSSTISPEWIDHIESSSSMVKFYHFPSPFVDSPHKCQGEAFLLLKGLEILEESNSTNLPLHIFKLSGRYRLTPLFSKETWLKTQTIFKRIEQDCFLFEPNPCVYTFLYKIFSKTHFNLWKKTCHDILREKKRESIEVIFCRIFEQDPSPVWFLEKEEWMGVEGWISHSGKKIEK